MSRAKIYYTTIMPNISETFWGFTHFFYILNHRVDINSDIWWRSAIDRTFINLKMNFSGIIFFFTKFHCFWHLKFFENQTDSEKKHNISHFLALYNLHYKLHRVLRIIAKSNCSTLLKGSEVSEVLNTNLLKDSNINKNHVYITIYDTRKMFQVPEALFTIEKSTRIVFASSNMNSRENQFKPKNAEAHSNLQTLHIVAVFKK